MSHILTYKARLEQVASRCWQTLDNQLFLLDNERILLAPRKLITDNNTNPFGDNDLCDVRASHFHDLGCRYHQLIYVTLPLQELRKKMYLRIHRKRSKEAFQNIWVCDDIPEYFLSVEKVGFNEISKIFKEILLACGVGKTLSNIMRFAVNFNAGWVFSGKAKIDLSKIYKSNI